MKTYTYLQSLITLELAYLLNDWGYILTPGIGKYGERIVTLSKED